MKRKESQRCRLGHRRKHFKRRDPSKDERSVVLIVCEGEKTEPNYFEDAKKKYALTAVDIQIYGKECGSNPKTVVEFAKEKKLEIESDGQEVDQVWCVFDRDDHEWLAEAMDQAKANGFEVAFSNPSFELWYLIHFEDQERHIERKDVTKKLKKHLKEYSKSIKGLFALLEERLPEAKKRADKMRNIHIRNTNPATYNPSTSVDQLIGYLQSICEK